MQLKRHSADYDPFAKFYKSEVMNDMAAVETAIAAFEACDAKSLSGKFSLWKHCPLSIFAHVALKA
jgi:hypothetical protein